MVRQRLWLCLPPVALCTFDQAVTLWGQPSFYWEGEYLIAFEGAPHGRWLLQQHPLAFLASGLVWILAYSGAIVLLPRRVSQTLALAIVIGHAWGASTWIMLSFTYGYWLCMLLFVTTSALVVLSWDKATADRVTPGVPARPIEAIDLTANPSANGHPAPSPQREEARAWPKGRRTPS